MTKTSELPPITESDLIAREERLAAKRVKLSPLHWLRQWLRDIDAKHLATRDG